LTAVCEDGGSRSPPPGKTVQAKKARVARASPPSFRKGTIRTGGGAKTTAAQFRPQEIMIQFTDFYDDIDFMIALFFNYMLNDAEIYEIANRLNNKTPDDVLAKIIANGPSGNNQGLLYNYLSVLEIKCLNPKRALTARVFYYILNNRLDFYKGIKFLDFKVIDHENITKYVGDDVGIERIIGNFYAVDDGDLRDEKNIETAIKYVFRDMEQYVQDNLAHFSIDNTIAEDNERTIIKTEMEKAKVKAFARGIEIRDHWEALYEARKKKNTD
jgi:hypothetical protein